MDDPKPRDGLPRNPDGSVNYAAMSRWLLEFVELGEAYASSPTRRRRRPRKTKRQKEITKIEGHVKILKDRALVEAAWQIICGENGFRRRDLKNTEIAYILKKKCLSPRPSKRRILNQLSAAKTFMEAHEQSSNYRAYIRRVKQRIENPLLTN
jgi:hypothetical protein